MSSDEGAVPEEGDRKVEEDGKVYVFRDGEWRPIRASLPPLRGRGRPGGTSWTP